MLHCRQSKYGPGPVVNLTLSGFELLFAAKFLSGIADYLYIATQSLAIRHRGENQADYTQWVYPKSCSASRRFGYQSTTYPEDSDPMLALAVKIENEEVSRALAHFTVAVCVSNLAVRFRFVEAGQAPWDHLAWVPTFASVAISRP